MEVSNRVLIRQSLLAMKLIAVDEDPEMIELTGGVSAEIVLAKTRAGPVCVKRTLPRLRVAGEWYASPARGEAEKKWIRLAGTFLPSNVPKIVGEDPQAHTFAMVYLDPAHFKNWKSLLRDGDISVATAASVGRIIGTVHSRTAGDAVVAAAFANDQDFADLRLKPYLAAAADANPGVAAPLRHLIERTASTKIALVHGDYSPKNILIGPSGPVVLDAECAWYGDPAFDAAFCLNHLFLKCAWKPRNAEAYLACARAFLDAYLSAAAGLDGKQLEARATTLLPGLMLARIDGKSPVEYLTDPAVRDKVRRFATAALSNPAVSLQPLLEAWQKEFQ